MIASRRSMLEWPFGRMLTVRFGSRAAGRRQAELGQFRLLNIGARIVNNQCLTDSIFIGN